MHCSTPIVFLIFCRPDLTAHVFEQIRVVKPTKLLVVADGPRTESESELCQQAREVTERVDWNCKVIRYYSDINLGCKKRVSSGLNWAFNNVEEAIILEDDCIPELSFFRFCEELLDHYRNDTRVMTISGANFQFGHQRTQYSYYYSLFPHCWGWATWKRAWQHYDLEMSLWPTIKEGNWLNDILRDTKLVEQWMQIFDHTFSGYIDTWDYQWTFACWLQSGLSILPNTNLVSNYGFDLRATHTTEPNLLSKMQTSPLNFPLDHPEFVIKDSYADTLTSKIFHKPDKYKSLKTKIKKIIKGLK